MEPTLLAVIIAVAVLAAGSLIFFVWLAVSMVRLTCHGCFTVLRFAWDRFAADLFGIGPTTSRFAPAGQTGQGPPRAYRGRCGNAHCGAALPRSARFCVRCGESTMTASRRVA